jgi:prepilin peptidase CpaA
MNMGHALGFLMLATVASLTAAVIDFRTGHIPNWLTLGTLALALTLRGSEGCAASGLRGGGAAMVTTLAGALFCALVPLILYVLAGMGGGDLKLLAALGAMCGPMVGLQVEMYSFVAVLLFAVARMTYEGRLGRTLLNSLSLLVNPFLPATRRSSIAPELMTSLRFGPAVAAGVVATTLAHWSLR